MWFCHQMYRYLSYQFLDLVFFYLLFMLKSSRSFIIGYLPLKNYPRTRAGIVLKSF